MVKQLDSLPAGPTDADRARAAVVRASSRPAWVDATSALCLGVAAPTAATETPWGYALGAALLVAATLVLLRGTHRRGRLTDDRAVTRGFATYAVCYLPLVCVLVLLDPGAPLWVLGPCGAAVAGGTYAYLRLDERYQTARLAKGDFGPYDLS